MKRRRPTSLILSGGAEKVTRPSAGVPKLARLRGVRVCSRRVVRWSFGSEPLHQRARILQIHRAADALKRAAANFGPQHNANSAIGSMSDRARRDWVRTGRRNAIQAADPRPSGLPRVNQLRRLHANPFASVSRVRPHERSAPKLPIQLPIYCSGSGFTDRTPWTSHPT